ncbi:hypothetical protein [Hydrogenophaga sp. NFH-34]|uniref:hypothetical protein n=1 Tax=Hydrogenophaga sp. NFH-34 TaxID=2744446 RepID=UPI001F26DAD1|nr:hypothetical protein [Hydrogenophaga sp. NFH-34]
MNKKDSIGVLRCKLKLVIMSHCRSDVPVRKVGMSLLAGEVDVYSSPSTLEMDLLAYVDQLKDSYIFPLLQWGRELREMSTKDVTPNAIPPLPKFQLELV